MNSQWWSKTLMLIAPLVLLSLMLAPLAYKYEILGLGMAFTALRWIAYIAIAGLVLTVLGLGFAFIMGLTADKRPLIVGLIIFLVPLFHIANIRIQSNGIPAIHDITTDLEEPPVFVKAIADRAGARNSLERDSESLAESELIAKQLQAYPDLETLRSDLAPQQAFARALEIVNSKDFEVINQDSSAGIIEVVATTFWFGFKDDLVIRIRPENGGSELDLRSVSRVGRSDLGANAARIRAVIKAFNS